MSTVALAGTSTTADPDHELLESALSSRGIIALGAAWDDPSVDWDRFDATVIRSTWGYDEDLEAFLAWSKGVPRLLNAAEVVAWNSDKRYLDALRATDVPTIETTYATSGAAAVLPEGDVVVKPSVGGGARGVARFARDEHALARAHVDDLASKGYVAMVQPHLATVAEAGETDVIVIDGKVSHAVVKRVTIGRDAAASPSGASRLERCSPRPDQLDVVAAALRAVPFAAPLCFARVDLVEAGSGPAVIELELIEPYLFLDSPAADRLAEAISRRIARRS